MFENLQRRLAAQSLGDSSSDYEEKHSIPAARSSPEPAAVVPTTALCRFFVLGKCRYGSRCTFSHTLPMQVSECARDETESLSAAAALVDCPFFLRGNCKYGEHCRLRHNPAMLSGTATVASARSTSRSERSSSLNYNAASAATTAVNNQQDFMCGICFDDIVQSGKHFGLLTCDHCFCLDCLRSWRQSKDMELEVIRACPACRLPSDFIVPSLIFVTGEEKRKVVDAYKSHLALRECKYFNGLFGSCPFGPRCFYAHRDSQGRDVKHLDRPKRSMKPRNRNGRHGGDAALQSLLQQYSHLFRFFEVADWDDFDLVGDMYDSDDSDDSDDDYFEYGFSDDDYDTE
ncbi:putative E3 ubiquitin-protein ligase makorin-1 [Phytophthora citrophthora]|uniref:E3 ubiquitin-protein ligase makorin-1 n=1 Tax=Phytophthora citrophthora TaxID=4793 RepID=A0AAD9G282_9STRA|nr:putative E3 ubiquitin-protein ligase makorin-1 [Phytophthora citrophthora]